MQETIAQMEAIDTNGADRQRDPTALLIAKATELEQDAARLCNENDAAMLNTKRECERATQQAQASIERRIKESEQLKQQLVDELGNLSTTIAASARSKEKTKKKLESHQQPLDVLN